MSTTMVTVDINECNNKVGRIDRKIWQALFTIYQVEGGSLTDMDNMLIDYGLIKQYIERNLDNFDFFWVCTGGKDGMTEIGEIQNYRDMYRIHRVLEDKVRIEK